MQDAGAVAHAWWRWPTCAMIVHRSEAVKAVHEDWQLRPGNHVQVAHLMMMSRSCPGCLIPLHRVVLAGGLQSLAGPEDCF